MPIKRRKDKRREALSEGAIRWLRGTPKDVPLADEAEGGWKYFETKESRAKVWAENRDWVLAEWIAENPGTRPEHWWNYDAPRWSEEMCKRHSVDYICEPRLRLGGTGTPMHEVFPAVMPCWTFGIPRMWVSDFDVGYYTGTAVDIHGKLIAPKNIGKSFSGAAIDPNEPPIFESEAAYLKRHALFLPGELRRLKAAAFEPVALHFRARTDVHHQ